MKKGFTLIELLAVIVILAIIALIVTPVVSNIVSNAKISSNARSVEGHIKNIELAIISQAFGSVTTGDMDAYNGETTGDNLKSALTLPESDKVTCVTYEIQNGTVISATQCKDKNNSWGNEYTYQNTTGAILITE